MNHETTVADALAARLAAWGVERLFGIPGGGSLHVIEAAARVGIPFVLTRTETAAALMAAATGELTGRPGVAVTGIGPGLAAATNGIAYAMLDRAPVVLITDAFDPTGQGYVSHQVIDQSALFTPITKARARLDGSNVAESIDALIATALAPPFGPVLIELPGGIAAQRADVAPAPAAPPVPSTMFDIGGARALLRQARRPAILVGLDVRSAAAAAALGRFAGKLGAPVLTTYKAKGAIADGHKLHVGLFTGAAAEAPCLSRADLIVQIGLDPVELQPQPWRYDAPILDIAAVGDRPLYAAPRARMIGPIDGALDLLMDAACAADWPAAEIAGLREEMRAALASPQGAPVTPQALVEAVHRAAPEGTRITVDAGAHMVPAMTFYPTERPGDVLISNGLSTMGLALPAAIAAALAEPDRRVVAFTGDGGLMMCAGELATAAETGAAIVVVVFNDAALSLIDIKQQAIGHPSRGVRTDRIDFVRMAESMGCAGQRVDRPDDLAGALDEAFATAGPCVIDARIDPGGYAAQFKSLRG